mgnify:CR=1 FL=1
MESNRAKILINNILAEVSTAWEDNKQGYTDWLKTDIGMTDEEIAELKEDNLFPEPTEIEQEMDV